MDAEIVKNSFFTWGVALFIAILLTIASFVALSILDRFKKQQPILEVFSKTHVLFVVIVSLYFATLALPLPEQAFAWRFKIMACAIAIQAGLWGNELILYLLRRSRVLGLDQEAVTSGSITVINFVTKTVLWSLVAVFLLSNLGFNVTALVTGLGVGGIAVALAVQNILGDLFASLSIVIDKPFQIGDLILVDSLKGRVEHIGLKTTRIRSVTGEEVIFANADLLQSRIKNLKRMTNRRITFEVGIKMETPINTVEKVPKILKEVLSAVSDVIFDRANFTSIGEFAYKYEIVYYLSNPEDKFYLEKQQQINLGILKRFEQEGIEFAYPTSVLYNLTTEAKK